MIFNQANDNSLTVLIIAKENCELIGNKFECMYMDKKIICRKYVRVLYTLFYIVHKLLYIVYIHIIIWYAMVLLFY
jgi:hypothetical protein